MRSPKPGAVLVVCCGATFVAFLDVSVVGIAFPDLTAEFSGTPIAALTWVVSAYAAVFAAFLTPAGRLADTVGRTRIFRWSLAGFTLASLLCAAAPSIELLIAGRAVQGAAAAGMTPAALGLIMATRPPQQLARALGVWVAVNGFSAVVGPVVGGVLVGPFGWRSVFVINLPVGAALMAAALRWLPRDEPAAGRAPDAVGTAALTLGIGAVVGGLTLGAEHGWTAPETLGLLVLGPLLGAVALLRSRGHAAPAVDIDLWRSRGYAACNAVAFALGVSMFAWLLAAALFTTRIWHYSVPASAGALVFGAVATMVTANLGGRVIGGHPQRYRWAALAGILGFAACTAFMGTDAFGPEARFWTAWVPAGILGGGGLGLASTAVSAAAGSALPPARFAAGIGMNLTARQLGGAVGAAGLGAVLAAHGGPTLEAFHFLYRACTVVTLVAAVLALAIVDRAPRPVAVRG